MTSQMQNKFIPPFKADVVGSLLRPQAILDARAAHSAGKLTREALWDIERAHIGEAVALQKSVGLNVCTDGEYHRRHWFMDFVERIEGVAFEGGLKTTFQTDSGPIEFAPPRVITARKLKRTRALAVDEFKDFKPLADAAGLMPKQGGLPPPLAHSRSGRAGVDINAYPDITDYFSELASVYRQEIAALYDPGCRYLQI